MGLRAVEAGAKVVLAFALVLARREMFPVEAVAVVLDSWRRQQSAKCGLVVRGACGTERGAPTCQQVRWWRAYWWCKGRVVVLLD